MTATADTPTPPAAPTVRLGIEGARRAAGSAAERIRVSVLSPAATALAPVRRRLGRVLGVVTPLGWGVIVATLAAGVGGLALGWWELTTVGLCGVAVLLLCAGFLIGRTEYDVTLDLTRQRVVAGERAVGSVTLRNPGRRALLPTRVILPVGPARATFDVPRLGVADVHDDVFAIPTSRRAVLQVGPVSAVRGDPIGIFERTVPWSDPVDLFVHPKTVPIDGTSAGFVRDLEGLPTRDLSPDDVSFHALRAYEPGDDLRHVHWRSSARVGTIVVRQFEDTRRSHVVVGLSRNAAEYGDPDEFELAVSTAGSIGLQALRDRREASVFAQQTKITTRSARPFLDALTRLDTARVSGIDELSAHAARAAPQASVVTLITGSRISAHELRAAARHLPSTVTAVGIVCELGAAPALRRLGDIAVVTLGDIADLHGALRKALA